MKVISAFEYAIREIAEPETLNNYRPETEAERTKRRINKLRSAAKGMKIKKPK